MKRNDCEIVKDLLPLYVDGLLSETSREFVKTHLVECPKCRKELDRLSSDIVIPVEKKNDGFKTFSKSIKKKILRKNVIVAIISVIMSAILLFGGFFVMFWYDTPVEWEDGLITVEKNDEGQDCLKFNGRNYSGSYWTTAKIQDGNGEKTVRIFYYVSNIWDRYFAKEMREEERYELMEKEVVSYTQEGNEPERRDVEKFDAIYYYPDTSYKDGWFWNKGYWKPNFENMYTEIPKGAVLIWEAE